MCKVRRESFSLYDKALYGLKVADYVAKLYGRFPQIYTEKGQFTRCTLRQRNLKTEFVLWNSSNVCRLHYADRKFENKTAASNLRFVSEKNSVREITWYRDVIAFKDPFQNLFKNKAETQSVLKILQLKSVLEKLRFRNALVWKSRPAIVIS